jgi:hypothetical protein
MNDTSNDEQPAPAPVKEESSNLDRILAKYITIWVWSILVGINTSVAFSFVNFGARSRGSSLLLVLGPVVVLGMVASLVAWIFILRYLRHFIIPKFFWMAPGEFEQHPSTYGAINSAARWTILALFFRLLLTAFDFAFSSVYF